MADENGLHDQVGTGPYKQSPQPPRSTQSPHLKQGPTPLCFHFPKVKLPRIFNTKSLDDILGVNSKSGAKSKFSRPRKLLSSTTSSSTSPHPTNLEIDLDQDSNSSVGITTPGITNTTGGTTVTGEGFTTTSGYFSDLDRRESCDLLVVDEPDFGDGESHRRRHSSLVSYYSHQSGGTGEEIRKDSIGKLQIRPNLPTCTPIIVKAGEPHQQRKSCDSTRSRKWSGSSLQKSTSSLTSAFLLRIPQFADKKKSPKSDTTNIKTKFAKKKPPPSKSQSSGSLNRVSAAVTVCANPNSARAKNSSTTPKTNSNPIAKQITKSDTYLNRIFGGSSTTAECSIAPPTNSSNSSKTTSKKAKSKTKSLESKETKRDRRSSSIVSEISSTSTTTTGDPSKQRSWTAVKKKWDLKLQLPTEGEAENLQDSKNSQESHTSQQRLLFIKSQIGHLVEAQERQRSLDREASSSSQSSGGVTTTRPHEPGRVSFRLEPEEIPDSTLKHSSSYNTTTTTESNNSVSGNSPIGESYCRNKEQKEEVLRSSHSSKTSSQDGGLDEEEDTEIQENMTKSSNPHHFHYASAAAASSNKGRNTTRQGGPSSSRGRNANQKQKHDLDNNPTKDAQNKDKIHLVVTLSFLQRPNSPCLLQPGFSGTSPSPSPTPTGTTATTTPITPTLTGVFSVAESKSCAKSSSKSKDGLKARTTNINEPRVIENENINVGGGCGMSCFSSRSDVLSPSTSGVMMPTKKTKGGNKGAKVSMYGTEQDDENGGGGRNKKISDTCSGDGGAISGRTTCHKASGQKSQSQFGQGDVLDYSNIRFTPDIAYLSSISTVDPSGRGTKFLQEEDEEDVVDIDINKMGDLQSPTYVKRTAHMFNSIYSSQNGSSSPPVGEHHNPSYLNVSKSISGYSCLSYNNNATNTNGTTSSSCVTNGSTSTKTSRLSNGASSSSTSATSPYSHRFINGSGTGSPGKSINRSEFRIRVNQKEEEVGSSSSKSNNSSRDLALNLSPTTNTDQVIDEPDSTSNYVPSHGKSFIMQRIERLYGSEAHAVTATSGIVTKKTVNPSGVGGGGTVTTIKFETLHHHQQSATSRNKERIIPIQVENNKENKAEQEDAVISSSTRSTTRSSIVSKDDREEEIRSQLSPTKIERVFRGDEILVGNNTDDNVDAAAPTKESEEPSSDMKSATSCHQSSSSSLLEPCPGKYKLETIHLDNQEKQLLMSSNKINSSSSSKANGDQSLLPRLADDDESTTTKPTTIPPLTKTKVNIDDVKDGNYFLNEMFKTVQELQRLCDKCSPELETLDQSSERAGNILAAIGKSQLLIKKKFKQFDELCKANLRGVVNDEPETTDEDLAGFWDMVMIQVEQVYASFKDIEENNSGDVSDSPPKISSPKKTTSTTARGVKPVVSKSQTSAAAKARDESRRKLLAEKRRQMKDQTQQDQQGTMAQEEVVIFTPGNN